MTSHLRGSVGVPSAARHPMQCGVIAAGGSQDAEASHFAGGDRCCRPRPDCVQPDTIAGTNQASVTIARQPQRIVSLSATATEMLFAINAGAQVVAVDDQSNYPANAPKTKLSGFQPSIEGIASYRPDLVVAVDDASGLVHGLGALGIPVLIETAAKNVEESYKQIEQLGTATGHVADAAALEKTMRSDLASIVASIPKPAKQLKVYHELDDTYYSATSAT